MIRRVDDTRVPRGSPDLARALSVRRCSVAADAALATVRRTYQSISASSASETFLHRDELAAGGASSGAQLPVRDDAAGEAHLGRFAHAQRRLADAADLAGEPDLAEHRGDALTGRLRTLEATAATIAQVGRRLVDRDAAGDVDEHVLGHQVQAGALLEHRQQQRQAVLIEAAGHPPRVAVRAGADERLDLDQHRPRTFDAAQHRGARRVGRPLGEEQLRRIGHRSRPVPVISKTPSSLTAPKRFLTARTTRCEWCFSPSK